MRIHIMPTQNRQCEEEKYSTISMTELENKIKKLDTAKQVIVSYYIRGFTTDEIAQISGCSKYDIEATIHHFIEQIHDIVASE